MLTKQQIEALAWLLFSQGRQWNDQAISDSLTKYPPEGIPQMNTDDIRAVIGEISIIRSFYADKARTLWREAFGQ